MRYYVGLDVSLNTVFVCIVDEKGRVIKEQGNTFYTRSDRELFVRYRFRDRKDRP